MKHKLSILSKADKKEILFWKKAIKYLKKGYGFCDETDGLTFLDPQRCGGCNATDIKKWIEGHIDLIKNW